MLVEANGAWVDIIFIFVYIAWFNLQAYKIFFLVEMIMWRLCILHNWFAIKIPLCIVYVYMYFAIGLVTLFVHATW